MKLIKINQISNLAASSLTLILALFSFFLVFTNKDKLPPEIPLWYSKIWGEQRLASQDWLWIIPIIIVTIFVMNQIISNLLVSKGLIGILTWSSVVVGLLITYSLIRILLLVL
jgi:hypothetical protein